MQILPCASCFAVEDNSPDESATEGPQEIGPPRSNRSSHHDEDISWRKSLRMFPGWPPEETKLSPDAHAHDLCCTEQQPMDLTDGILSRPANSQEGPSPQLSISDGCPYYDKSLDPRNPTRDSQNRRPWAQWSESMPSSSPTHSNYESFLRHRRRLLPSPVRGRSQSAGRIQGLGALVWPPPEEIRSFADPLKHRLRTEGLAIRPYVKRIDPLQSRLPDEEEGIWRSSLRAYRQEERAEVRSEDVLLRANRKATFSKESVGSRALVPVSNTPQEIVAEPSRRPAGFMGDPNCSDEHENPPLPHFEKPPQRNPRKRPKQGRRFHYRLPEVYGGGTVLLNRSHKLISNHDEDYARDEYQEGHSRSQFHHVQGHLRDGKPQESENVATENGQTEDITQMLGKPISMPECNSEAPPDPNRLSQETGDNWSTEKVIPSLQTITLRTSGKSTDPSPRANRHTTEMQSAIHSQVGKTDRSQGRLGIAKLHTSSDCSQLGSPAETRRRPKSLKSKSFGRPQPRGLGNRHITFSSLAKSGKDEYGEKTWDLPWRKLTPYFSKLSHLPMLGQSYQAKAPFATSRLVDRHLRCLPSSTPPEHIPSQHASDLSRKYRHTVSSTSADHNLSKRRWAARLKKDHQRMNGGSSEHNRERRRRSFSAGDGGLGEFSSMLQYSIQNLINRRGHSKKTFESLHRAIASDSQMRPRRRFSMFRNGLHVLAKRFPMKGAHGHTPPKSLSRCPSSREVSGFSSLKESSAALTRGSTKLKETAGNQISPRAITDGPSLYSKSSPTLSELPNEAGNLSIRGNVAHAKIFLSKKEMQNAIRGGSPPTSQGLGHSSAISQHASHELTSLMIVSRGKCQHKKIPDQTAASVEEDSSSLNLPSAGTGKPPIDHKSASGQDSTAFERVAPLPTQKTTPWSLISRSTAFSERNRYQSAVRSSSSSKTGWSRASPKTETFSSTSESSFRRRRKAPVPRQNGKVAHAAEHLRKGGHGLMQSKLGRRGMKISINSPGNSTASQDASASQRRMRSKVQSSNFLSSELGNPPQATQVDSRSYVDHQLRFSEREVEIRANVQKSDPSIGGMISVELSPDQVLADSHPALSPDMHSERHDLGVRTEASSTVELSAPGAPQTTTRDEFHTESASRFSESLGTSSVVDTSRPTEVLLGQLNLISESNDKDSHPAADAMQDQVDNVLTSPNDQKQQWEHGREGNDQSHERLSHSVVSNGLQDEKRFIDQLVHESHTAEFLGPSPEDNVGHISSAYTETHEIESLGGGRHQLNELLHEHKDHLNSESHGRDASTIQSFQQRVDVAGRSPTTPAFLSRQGDIRAHQATSILTSGGEILDHQNARHGETDLTQTQQEVVSLPTSAGHVNQQGENEKSEDLSLGYRQSAPIFSHLLKDGMQALHQLEQESDAPNEAAPPTAGNLKGPGDFMDHQRFSENNQSTGCSDGENQEIIDQRLLDEAASIAQSKILQETYHAPGAEILQLLAQKTKGKDQCMDQASPRAPHLPDDGNQAHTLQLSQELSALEPLDSGGMSQENISEDYSTVGIDDNKVGQTETTHIHESPAAFGATEITERPQGSRNISSDTYNIFSGNRGEMLEQLNFPTDASENIQQMALALTNAEPLLFEQQNMPRKDFQLATDLPPLPGPRSWEEEIGYLRKVREELQHLNRPQDGQQSIAKMEELGHHIPQNADAEQSRPAMAQSIEVESPAFSHHQHLPHSRDDKPSEGVRLVEKLSSVAYPLLGTVGGLLQELHSLDNLHPTKESDARTLETNDKPFVDILPNDFSPLLQMSPAQEDGICTVPQIAQDLSSLHHIGPPRDDTVKNCEEQEPPGIERHSKSIFVQNDKPDQDGRDISQQNHKSPLAFCQHQHRAQQGDSTMSENYEWINELSIRIDANGLQLSSERSHSLDESHVSTSNLQSHTSPVLDEKMGPLPSHSQTKFEAPEGGHYAANVLQDQVGNILTSSNVREQLFQRREHGHGENHQSTERLSEYMVSHEQNFVDQLPQESHTPGHLGRSREDKVRQVPWSIRETDGIQTLGGGHDEISELRQQYKIDKLNSENYGHQPSGAESFQQQVSSKPPFLSHYGDSHAPESTNILTSGGKIRHHQYLQSDQQDWSNMTQRQQEVFSRRTHAGHETQLAEYGERKELPSDDSQSTPVFSHLLKDGIQTLRKLEQELDTVSETVPSNVGHVEPDGQGEFTALQRISENNQSIGSTEGEKQEILEQRLLDEMASVGQSKRLQETYHALGEEIFQLLAQRAKEKNQSMDQALSPGAPHLPEDGNQEHPLLQLAQALSTLKPLDSRNMSQGHISEPYSTMGIRDDKKVQTEMTNVHESPAVVGATETGERFQGLRNISSEASPTFSGNQGERVEQFNIPVHAREDILRMFLTFLQQQQDMPRKIFQLSSDLAPSMGPRSWEDDICSLRKIQEELQRLNQSDPAGEAGSTIFEPHHPAPDRQHSAESNLELGNLIQQNDQAEQSRPGMAQSNDGEFPAFSHDQQLLLRDNPPREDVQLVDELSSITSPFLGNIGALMQDLQAQMSPALEDNMRVVHKLTQELSSLDRIGHPRHDKASNFEEEEPPEIQLHSESNLTVVDQAILPSDKADQGHRDPSPQNPMIENNFSELIFSEKLAVWESLSRGHDRGTWLPTTVRDDMDVAGRGLSEKVRSVSRQMLGLDLAQSPTRSDSTLIDVNEFDRVVAAKPVQDAIERPQPFWSPAKAPDKVAHLAGEIASEHFSRLAVSGEDVNERSMMSGAIGLNENLEDIMGTTIRSTENQSTEKFSQLPISGKVAAWESRSESGNMDNYMSSMVNESLTKDAVSGTAPSDSTRFFIESNNFHSVQDSRKGIEEKISESASQKPRMRISIIDRDKLDKLEFSQKISAWELLSSMDDSPRERPNNDEPKFTLETDQQALNESNDESMVKLGAPEEILETPDFSKEKMASPLQDGLIRTLEIQRRVHYNELPDVSEFQDTHLNLGESSGRFRKQDGSGEIEVESSFGDSQPEDGDLKSIRPRNRSSLVRPALKSSLIASPEGNDEFQSPVSQETPASISNIGYAEMISSKYSELQESSSSTGAFEPVTRVPFEDTDSQPSLTASPRSRNKSLFVRPVLRESLKPLESESADEDSAQLRAQLDSRRQQRRSSTRGIYEQRSGLAASFEGAGALISGDSEPWGGMNNLPPVLTRAKSLLVRPALKKSLIMIESPEMDRSDGSDSETSWPRSSISIDEVFRLGLAENLESLLESAASTPRGSPDSQASSTESFAPPRIGRKKSSIVRPSLKRSLTTTPDTAPTSPSDLLSIHAEKRPRRPTTRAIDEQGVGLLAGTSDSPQEFQTSQSPSDGSFERSRSKSRTRSFLVRPSLKPSLSVKERDEETAQEPQLEDGVSRRRPTRRSIVFGPEFGLRGTLAGPVDSLQSREASTSKGNSPGLGESSAPSSSRAHSVLHRPSLRSSLMTTAAQMEEAELESDYGGRRRSSTRAIADQPVGLASSIAEEQASSGMSSPGGSESSRASSTRSRTKSLLVRPALRKSLIQDRISAESSPAGPSLLSSDTDDSSELQVATDSDPESTTGRLVRRHEGLRLSLEPEIPGTSANSSGESASELPAGASSPPTRSRTRSSILKRSLAFASSDHNQNFAELAVQREFRAEFSPPQPNPGDHPSTSASPGSLSPAERVESKSSEAPTYSLGNPNAESSSRPRYKSRSQSLLISPVPRASPVPNSEADRAFAELHLGTDRRAAQRRPPNETAVAKTTLGSDGSQEGQLDSWAPPSAAEDPATNHQSFAGSESVAVEKNTTGAAKTTRENNFGDPLASASPEILDELAGPDQGGPSSENYGDRSDQGAQADHVGDNHWYMKVLGT